MTGNITLPLGSRELVELSPLRPSLTPFHQWHSSCHVIYVLANRRISELVITVDSKSEQTLYGLPVHTIIWLAFTNEWPTLVVYMIAEKGRGGSLIDESNRYLRLGSRVGERV